MKLTRPRPSPLGLTVLLMLLGGPLHPYEMRRRMKAWRKDQVVNIEQPTSLYRTIERLAAAGLIAVRERQRGDRFPDRTVYELTDDGLRVGREWLAEMLAVPRSEFPVFPAALSFVFGLYPQEAADALERRRTTLRERVHELDAELADGEGPHPPRVTLLETEYIRQVTTAEINWLDGVLDDLRSGNLTWTGDDLRESSKSFLPAESDDQGQ
jgi:DNA-binding PadR family transcriptional regulator